MTYVRQSQITPRKQEVDVLFLHSDCHTQEEVADRNEKMGIKGCKGFH